MKKPIVLVALISMLFFACEKDEITQTVHIINTGTVASIKNYRAEVTSSLTGIKDKKISEHGHVWSTAPSPTVELSTKTELGNVSSDGDFTSQITNLNKGTKYYLRAYTVSNSNVEYGEEVSFETGNESFVIKTWNYVSTDAEKTKRAWFMIYSNDGELITFQEVSNNSSYNIELPITSSSERFMVQVFNSIEYVDPTRLNDYKMHCYLDVKPCVWNLGSPSSSTSYSKIGENTITLNDIVWYEPYEFKNKHTSASPNEFDGTIKFDQYFDPDKIFLMYNNAHNVPYYKLLDNVVLNEDYTLESTDFTQMDFVEISIPINESGYIFVESEVDLELEFDSYYTTHWEKTDNKSSVRGYYPGNTFNGYATYILIRNSGVSEKMWKIRGDVPDKFNQVTAEIETINPNIFDYSLSITGAADFVRQEWWHPGDVNFDYFIYGAINSVASFSAPELPSEIKNINPAFLDLNNAKISNTSFFEYDIFDNYDDYIDFYFSNTNNIWRVEMTWLEKSIYPSTKFTNKPIKKDNIREIETFGRSF